jgi:hypothetical protein
MFNLEQEVVVKVNDLPNSTIKGLELGATSFSRMLVKLLLAQTRVVINNLIPLAFFAMTHCKSIWC